MLKIKFTDILNTEPSAICILVADDLKPLGQVAAKYGGIVNQFLNNNANFTAKFGQIKSITALTPNNQFCYIIMIGVGKVSELTCNKIEELGGKTSTTLQNANVEVGMIEAYGLGEFASWQVAVSLAYGLSLGSYSFNKYFTTKTPEELPKLTTVEIHTSESESAIREFEKSQEVIKAIYLARNLISEPANILYPESYVERIVNELDPLGVSIEVFNEQEMQKLGMGALLGVGQGSHRESRLVVMRYNGKADSSAPLAFVGKGVTFDTGGISLKPSLNMHKMKYDMSGSAAVVGTIRALAGRKAKVNVVGVIGLVENMPGGNAQRPGDVVKSMSGQTIEVLNTDAEGRLVLADVLWYTQDRFKPQIMINLATLTGAIVTALGSTYGGLFSNNDELINNLQEAGKYAGENLWPMPLHKEFDEMIKSDIADIANIGSPTGTASSCTAAKFLQRFVNNVPWAHLDIAGMAWESQGRALVPKGAVAFGVRLLNELVKKYYEAS